MPKPALLIVALGASIALSAVTLRSASAQQADVAPPNPPRTQQEILQERMQACKELRGSALRECMNNYVGQRTKRKEPDITSGTPPQRDSESEQESERDQLGHSNPKPR